MSGFDFAISGYRVLHLIDEVGDLSYYRAIREADGRTVIFKVFKPAHFDASEWNCRKLEYEIIRKLEAVENVIKTYGMEIYQNCLILMLEDFGGDSLKILLDKQKKAGEGIFTLDEFFNIAILITQALANIHTAHVIHKDINPANIIYNSTSRMLKIAGFHLSTTLSKEYPDLRSSGKIEGTLSYISPEQTGRINRVVDYRSDLYSLGATFYEMLTGHPPFESEDSLVLVYNHIAKIPQEVIAVNPAIPSAVSDIVMKLLAKNAEDRYQSAYGLKADLERCRSALTSQPAPSGLSDSRFELGQDDHPGRLQFPQKLYGRAAEVAALTAAFERTAAGSRELVLLAGHAGAGMSTLAAELRSTVIKKHGYFINSKFNHYEENTPYMAFTRIFNQLGDMVLTESETALQQWRNKILTAVGGNGAVLTEIMPGLEKIIGAQPAVPNLDLQESHNRFIFTFQNFAQAICTAERPFVVFIDDLQWADHASFELLTTLMTGEKITHLLLIGAYRINDTDRIRPFMTAVGDLAAAGVAVQTIELKNLQPEDVRELIQDTLLCQPDDSLALTELVYKKTQGHPFFTRQFLQNIYNEGLIYFDFRTRRWTWDIAHINSQQITDNVVDLITGSLRKLPDEVLKLLQKAACIGNEFSLKSLASISRVEESIVKDMLLSAAADNILIPLDDYYKLSETAAQSRFRFRHDRLQQAAYSQIPIPERQNIHLEIARFLLENTPQAEIGQNVFNIVRHYNLAISAITEAGELQRVAELNIHASDIAYRSAAFRSAQAYLERALALMPENAWTAYYDSMLKIHLQLALVLSHMGDMEHMERIAQTTETYARSLMDKARVKHAKIHAALASGAHLEAIDIGMAIMEELGISINRDPNPEDAVIYLTETADLFTEDKLKSLEIMPEAPAETGLIYETAILINASIYTTNIYFHYIFVSRIAKLCLERGLTPNAISRLVTFAMIVGSALHDVPKMRMLTDACMKLVNGKYSSHNFASHLSVAIGQFIIHRYKHLKYTLPVLEEGVREGLGSGLFHHCSTSAWCHAWYNLFLGTPLDDVEKDSLKAIEICKKIQMERMMNWCLLIYQAVLNLQGKNDNPWIIKNEAISDDKLLAHAIQYNDFTEAFRIYYYKAWLRYIFGREKEAVDLFHEAESFLLGGTGMYIMPLFYLYDTLANAAVFGRKSPEEQRLIMKRINRNLKDIENWALFAPMNHQHKKDLMEAEKARLEGRIDEAAGFYEKAINGALVNGFINEQAIACELTAKFFLTRGYEEIAHLYMLKAHGSYIRWQAWAKVRDIENNYSQWFKAQRGADRKRAMENPEESGILDIKSVIKASQTISSQIILKELLAKLMEIVIENAGAQQGCILLDKEGKWIIGAKWPENSSNSRSSSNSLSSMDPADLKNTGKTQAAEVEESGSVSSSIVRYVARTRESIVLDNAAAEGLFTDDPYIKSNRVKSVICIPLLNLRRLTGILYLENNLAVNTFTRARIEVLELLAGQAAIALENAVLYKQAQQEIAERKAAQEALKVSEEWFKTIFDSVNDAIFVHDSTTWKIMDINPAMCRMFGYTREEALMLKGEEINSNEPDYTSKEGLEFMRKAVEEGPQLFEWKNKDKNGRFFWTEVNTRLAFIGGNYRIVVVSRDITARKQAEEALKESEERFRLFMHHFPGLAYIKDKDTRVIFANHGFLTHLNIDPLEMIGKTNREIFPAEFAKHVTDDDMRVLKSGQSHEIEEYFNGRTWSTYKFPIPQPGNSFLLGGLTLDITVRKQAEAQLERNLHETQLRYELSRTLAGAETEDEVLDILISRSGLYPQVLVGIGTLEETESGRVAILRRQNVFESGLIPGLQPGDTLTEARLPGIHLLRPDQPFIINDIWAEKKIDKSNQIIDIPAGVNSLAIFPLNTGNEWIGYIGLLSKQQDFFDEKKERLYQTLAEQGSVALRAARLREKIRESQQRLSLFVQESPLGVIEWNMEFKATSWNPAAERIFGYTCEEALNRHASIIVPEQARPMVDQVWQNLLAQKGGIYSENENITKDGRIIICEWFNAPLVDPEGRIIGVAALVQDITERKRTEAKLEYNLRETQIRYEVSRALAGAETEEEVLDVLIQQSGIYPNAFVTICIYENTENERNVVLRRQDVFNSGLTANLQTGERLPASTFTTVSLFISDQPFISNYISTDKRVDTASLELLDNGGIVSIACFPLIAGNERFGFIGIMSSQQDFFNDEKQHLYQTLAAQGATALRAARLREKIRESQQRLSLFVQESPLGVIEWNMEFKATSWNPAAERIFGYTCEEALNRHASIIVPEQARPMVDQVWQNLLAQKGGIYSENENITKDGRIIICEWFNAPLVDPEGRIIGVAALVQDITERKRIEAQLERNLRETQIRYEVSRALAGAETEEEVLDVLIQQSGIYPNAHVGISTFDTTENERDVILRRQNTFNSGLTANLQTGERLPASTFSMINLFRSDQPFISNDIYTDERIDQASMEVYRKSGIVSMACFQLTSGSDWIGFVSITSGLPDFFDEEKQHLYQTLAEQGATAFRTARLREKIRESQQRLSLLVRQSPLGVIEWNMEFKAVSWNPAAERIFGYSVEEALNRHASIILPEQKRIVVEQLWQDLLAQEGGLYGEFENMTRDGRMIICEWFNAPLIDQEDHVIGAVSFIQDITERKKTEVKLDYNLRETQIRYEVSQALAGAEFEEEVLDVLIQHSGFFPEAFVTICTFENTENERDVIIRRQDVFKSGLIARIQTGTRLPISTFSTLSQLRPEQPFISSDIFSDKRIDSASIGIHRLSGVVSLAFFPLATGNEWIGYIGVLSRQPNFFDDKKQHLYQTLAEQGTVALRAARLREKIRDSQQRLSLLIKQSPLGVIEWNMEHKIISWNPSAERIFGYTSKEALNCLSNIIVPEQARHMISQEWQILLSQKGGTYSENENITKDGRLIICEWFNNTLVDSEDRIIGVASLLQDITERKRAEEELQAKTKELDLYFTSSLDLLCIADTDGYFRRLNPEWEKTLGYTIAELIGTKFLDLVHPDDLQATIAVISDLKGQKEVRSFENRYRCKDGSFRWIEWRSYPVGKMIYAVARDITDRKRIEEALEKRIVALTRPLDAPEGIDFEDLFNLQDIQKLQDQFAAAFGVASLITYPDGTPITQPSNFTDLCGNIIRESPAGVKKCEYSDSMLGAYNPSGTNIQHCLSAGLSNAGTSIMVGGRHIANWLIGQVRDESHNEEDIVKYALEIGVDEKKFRAAYHKVPFMDKGQFEKVAQMLNVMANHLSDSAYQNVQQARFITERKRAEEELARHRDHLEELVLERTRELETAQEELLRKERLSVLGQLTATVSHELRNPLGVIRSSAFYLKEKVRDIDDKIRKHLNRIEFQVELCNWIVEELLEYTRGSKPEMMVGNISTCLRNTLDDIQEIENIVITKNLPEDLPNFSFDQAKIRRVITNLITNAAHAVRDRKEKIERGNDSYIPEIRVSAGPAEGAGTAEGGIEIIIEDNGIGMDEITVKKAFEPLFTTRARGTGLGLSIVTKIMDEHKGTIEIKSKIHEGTRVILRLPVKAEAG